MRNATLAIGAGLLLAASVAGPVSARGPAPDTNPKACWGVVTGQAAIGGGIGEHSSQQANPRAGLGNLARDLGFDSLAELGAFLATVDGIDSTECDSGGI
jgi:hypothetical protein